MVQEENVGVLRAEIIREFGWLGLGDAAGRAGRGVFKTPGKTCSRRIFPNGNKLLIIRKSIRDIPERE